MFGHLPELFIITVIALIVFGPEKLPEVANSAGKMMRELREAMDAAMNPQDVEVPEDFSTYYYESLARSDEEVPVAEEVEGFHDSYDELYIEDDFGTEPEEFDASEGIESESGSAEVDAPQASVPADRHPETPS